MASTCPMHAIRPMTSTRPAARSSGTTPATAKAVAAGRLRSMAAASTPGTSAAATSSSTHRPAPRSAPSPSRCHTATQFRSPRSPAPWATSSTAPCYAHSTSAPTPTCGVSQETAGLAPRRSLSVGTSTSARRAATCTRSTSRQVRWPAPSTSGPGSRSQTRPTLCSWPACPPARATYSRRPATA